MLSNNSILLIYTIEELHLFTRKGKMRKGGRMLPTVAPKALTPFSSLRVKRCKSSPIYTQKIENWIIPKPNDTINPQK